MLLRELFDLDRRKVIGSSDLPPLADEDRRGGGERKGSYWIKDATKVPLAKDQYGHADWCMTVYLEPEKFGLTHEKIIEIARELDPNTASVLERNLSPNHLGGRALGEAILMMHGWAYLEYDIPSYVSIRAGKDHVRETVQNLAERYPLLQVDQIVLSKINTDKPGRWDSDRVETRRFYKEDSGFGGHFSDLLKTSSGQGPAATGWFYKKTSDYRNGINPEKGYVNHGNAVYRDQYYITCIPESHGRALRDRTSWVRFPTTVLRGEEFNSTSRAGELLVYSARPFSIPADQIQVWNGQRWVFLETAN